MWLIVLDAPAMKTVSRGTAHDPEVFSQVIAVNLVGSFHLASISAEGMINAPALTKDGERGVIITASVAAYDGQIGQTPMLLRKLPLLA